MTLVEGTDWAVKAEQDFGFMRWVNRTGWPPGPWDDEPDHMEWVYADFPCAILRSTSGALCGYVGLPSTHPYYNRDYDEIPVRVHGGLTFAAESLRRLQLALCSPIWWIGFDCGHGGDYIPRWTIAQPGDEYRTLEYVRAEVEQLVEQLK